MSQGTFITIEGIDGAGKTGAVKALDNAFDIRRTCEPSGSWTGKQVRRALKEDTPSFTDFFLFMADRNYHIQNFIVPELEHGEVVVSDRFSDSTLAYQYAQLDDHLDNTDEWMNEVMRPWNIEPDFTIYIDITVDTALERADGEEKYENRETLEIVQSRYEKLIYEDPDRFLRVDGELPQKYVQARVVDLVDQRIS